MKGFLERHGGSIAGTIDTFDRVIFKGHLNGFFPSGAFGRYLWQRNVLLKDAGRFFEAETRRIRDRIASVAAAAARPVEYLAGASTHRSGTSKEARARQIAERDGVTEGLVCVLSVVEPCRSFTVVPNRQTQRLEVVHRPRKCLSSPTVRTTNSWAVKGDPTHPANFGRLCSKGSALARRSPSTAACSIR